MYSLNTIYTILGLSLHPLIRIKAMFKRAGFINKHCISVIVIYDKNLRTTDIDFILESD